MALHIEVSFIHLGRGHCVHYDSTVRPCLSDGISFLTFCWINEVAGLTNHGLEAGSRTHDAHVHMYIKMKHF